MSDDLTPTHRPDDNNAKRTGAPVPDPDETRVKQDPPAPDANGRAAITPTPAGADDTLKQLAPLRLVTGAGSFVPGSRVGPYALREFLGRGAFGEVWLAERDSQIAKNRLAVKLPRSASLDLSGIRAEAEAWIRCGSHPNVLPIFEVDLYEGQPVIASEYAPGGSLKEWLGKSGGRVPAEPALRMAVSILEGLGHLHARGVVHRDLKPANILMQGDCPRIADFGLARFVRPGAAVAELAGTPAYMSPEALAGMASERTDLWSVGVILYQMLTGSLPFAGVTPDQLRAAMGASQVPPFPDALPAAVRHVVATALDRDPVNRYPSAAAMREDVVRGLRRLALDRAGEAELNVNSIAPAGFVLRATTVCCEAGGESERRYERTFPLLRKRVLIGRASVCDISVPEDQHLSRVGCTLEWDEGRATFVVIGASISANQVWVANRPLKPGEARPLSVGEWFVVGQTRFVFEQST